MWQPTSRLIHSSSLQAARGVMGLSTAVVAYPINMFVIRQSVSVPALLNVLVPTETLSLTRPIRDDRVRQLEPTVEEVEIRELNFNIPNETPF
jgi:hypothetical protein